MYYALGCIMENDLDVNEITLHIVQPRIENPIKTHTITYAELMEFKEELIEAINMVDTNPDTFVAGSHCTFCNQVQCPTWHDHLREETGVAVTDTMEIALNPDELDVDQLFKIIEFKSKADAFFKHAEALFYDKAIKGEIDLSKYGKKLVKKLSDRAWKEGKIPYRKLGLKKSDVYEEKPLSPAKVGKLIDGSKKDVLDSAVERNETGYKIVKDTVKGEAVNLTVSDTMQIN